MLRFPFSVVFFVCYVATRKNAPYFSKFIIYHANVDFFGVIFMERNSFNLEKRLFLTFVCILLLESH